MVLCRFDNSGTLMCVAHRRGVTILDTGLSTSSSSSSSPSSSSPQSSSSSISLQPISKVREELASLVHVKLAVQLHTTPIIAVVGGGTTTTLSSSSSSGNPAANNHHHDPATITTTSGLGSDRCLSLYDMHHRDVLAELHFDTAILNVVMNKLRFVVILERATYVFDTTTLEQIACLRTTSPINKLGLGTLCDVNDVYENCFYAFPHGVTLNPGSCFESSSHDPSRNRMMTGSRLTMSSAAGGGAVGEARNVAPATGGDIVVVNAVDVVQICVIRAHREPIAALQFAASGARLATCSTQGTNIKVFSCPSGGLLYQFRRGQTVARIQCLVFNVQADLLVAASDNGTIHLFHCGDSQSLAQPQNNNNTNAHQHPHQLHAMSTTNRNSYALAGGSVLGLAGGGGGTRSFAKIHLPVKTRCTCSFGENSRVLNVVMQIPLSVEANSMSSSSTTTVVLAQYSVDRDCKMLRECSVAELVKPS